jgi:hypothetical protein
MKKCLICHHVELENAATCPKCGEATWAFVVADALEKALTDHAELLAALADAPPIAPEPAAPKRKGRR